MKVYSSGFEWLTLPLENGDRTKAEVTGNPVTIEDLNQFVVFEFQVKGLRGMSTLF